MEDRGKDLLPDAIEDNKVVPIDEESLPAPSSSLWRLVPGAIFVLVGLTVFTLVVVTVDAHQRNLLLGGTAAFLILVFIFAGLLVRSYNRDKRKFKEQTPYRDDHIIQ